MRGTPKNAVHFLETPSRPYESYTFARGISLSESDGESLGRAGTGPDSQIRSLLGERIADNADELIALCRNLVRIPSENPPGDTRRIAEYAAEFLGSIDGAAVEAVVGREPFVNVTARVKGTSGGRRGGCADLR